MALVGRYVCRCVPVVVLLPRAKDLQYVWSCECFRETFRVISIHSRITIAVSACWGRYGAALTPVRLTLPTCFSHLSASSCAAYAARCAGVRPELSAVNSVSYGKAGVVSFASSCSGTGGSTGRESAGRGKASMTFPPSSTIAARHATCPACVQRRRGQYCHYITPRSRVLCLM